MTEIYYCPPNRRVPNSHLPVIIHRQALRPPYQEHDVRQQIEQNDWLHGGTWGPVPRHHFHPNTHEVYAVCHGSSTLSLGSFPDDEAQVGWREHIVQVQAGDVIVLPAGVSHCSVQWDDGYRYLGFYPKGAPKWKNEYCRDEARLGEFTAEASEVPIPPTDPVTGLRGGVVEIWNRPAWMHLAPDKT